MSRFELLVTKNIFTRLNLKFYPFGLLNGTFQFKFEHFESEKQSHTFGIGYGNWKIDANSIYHKNFKALNISYESRNYYQSLNNTLGKKYKGIEFQLRVTRLNGNRAFYALDSLNRPSSSNQIIVIQADYSNSLAIILKNGKQFSKENNFICSMEIGVGLAIFYDLRVLSRNIVGYKGSRGPDTIDFGWPISKGIHPFPWASKGLNVLPLLKATIGLGVPVGK